MALNNTQVKNAKPGRHADGKGLYLLVNKNGSGSWVLRVQVEGKRRDIGLGSATTLKLADARTKAAELRALARQGLDPKVERDRKPIEVPSFEDAARECHGEMKVGWRNKKHRDGWLASLTTHIFPALGDKPVDAVTSIMVRDALAPIWLKIPETSRRALQRIGAVLDYAHIKGWRPEETSLKSVRKGLPRQPKGDNHFEAMPYQDVPAYMQKLEAAAPTAGRDALRFTVLNAVRSNETRFAVRSEFDLGKAVWTIPGARMKMNETHLVPLTKAAIEIVERRLAEMKPEQDLIFSAAKGKAISDMTMTKVLRDDEHLSITTHGFRSSFTDWAAELTDYPQGNCRQGSRPQAARQGRGGLSSNRLFRKAPEADGCLGDVYRSDGRMTRRAGFVPVVLSPNEAEKIAAWVLTIACPKPTILGSAGLSLGDLKANDRAFRNQLRDLCACLLPRRTGRPRFDQSTYHLPLTSLKLIDRRMVAHQAPRDLRASIGRMVAAGKQKRGVRLSLADRKRNVSNTGPNVYQEETKRNYRWRIEKIEAEERSRNNEVAALTAQIQDNPELGRQISAIFHGLLSFE